MTNANDPVFSTDTINPLDGVFNHPPIGLTKREYFAAMSMQGMLANITQDYAIPNVNEKAMEAALKREKEFIEAVAEKSIKYADALIKKLNK